MDRCTVLVVDDDVRMLDAIRRRARGLRDVRVLTARNSRVALEIAKSTPPALAIVDLLLGAESGVELISRLRRAHGLLKIAAVTGAASDSLREMALSAGAAACFSKPFTIPYVAEEIGFEHEALAAASLIEHDSLARAEWDHVHRVFGDCDRNVSRAARVLGISPNTLRTKVAKSRPDR